MKKKFLTKSEKKVFTQEGEKKIKELGKRLDRFTELNKNTNHINYKIFHLLRDSFVYVNAYTKISKNKKALIEGYQDENIIVNFGLEQAKRIAKKITQGNYNFSPVKRTWVPKPGRKTKRPVDVPTQSDRVMQEVIRGILEAIYEPVFKEWGEKTNNLSNNYGFRPKHSVWSALEKLQKYSQRCNIVIEGDIISAYNNMDHSRLLGIIRKRIRDKKFLKLIKNMLKSGILDRGAYEHSLNGTPQGGIVSPILFNIYMLDFDQYVYKEFIVPILKSNEKKPKREKVSTAYIEARRKVAIAKRELGKAKKNTKTKTKEIKMLRKKIKQFANERNKTPYAKVESLPKGSLYVRYADDWVLALTCSKKAAVEIKQKIAEYLKEKKKMELDMEKTKVSFLSTGYKFLGFEIRMRITKPKQMRVLQLDKKTGIYSRVLKRTTSRQITIEPDSGRILTRLKRLKMCRKNYDPAAKPAWIIYDEFEIVQKYAQIFRGLFNYYEPCERLSRLNYVSYVLQYSCARTLARRKKISMKKIFQLYGKNLTIKKTILGTKKEMIRTIQFQDLTTLKKTVRIKIKEKNLCY